MKVMIATDGSSTAVEAARRAVGLLRSDAQIALATVIEARTDVAEDAGGFAGPLLTEDEADAEWAGAVAAGEQALAKTRAALGGAPDEERIVPTAATVADALIAVMEEERPDLVVLGSEQPSWFERLVHGTVEGRLLYRSPCPMLIVNR